MKLSTRWQMNGLLHEVRGTAKEIAGKVTANSLLATKGRIEKIAGGCQRKIGKFQGVVWF